MQPARGIGDKDIDVAGPGGLQCIERDRRAVCPGVLCNHRHLVAIAPHLQLFHRGRAEGVSGRQHHRATLGHIAPRQLADGGGLAHPVHAHHQDDEGLLARHVQGLLAGLQQTQQLLPQGCLQALGVGKFLARYPLGEVADDIPGGIHAHVGQQQARFQLLEQALINFLATEKQGAHALQQVLTGATQTAPQPREESLPAGILAGIRRVAVRLSLQLRLQACRLSRVVRSRPGGRRPRFAGLTEDCASASFLRLKNFISACLLSC